MTFPQNEKKDTVGITGIIVPIFHLRTFCHWRPVYSTSLWLSSTSQEGAGQWTLAISGTPVRGLEEAGATKIAHERAEVSTQKTDMRGLLPVCLPTSVSSGQW